MTHNMQINYGMLDLKPVIYRVIPEDFGWGLWRRRRYFVETDFVRIGPFSTQAEALETLALGHVSPRDIILVDRTTS